MKRSIGIIILISLAACTTVQRQSRFIEPFPRADTKDRPINYQTKKVYHFTSPDIRIDNQFDGARMNACKVLNDSTVQVVITDEVGDDTPRAYISLKAQKATLALIQVLQNKIFKS